MKRGLYTLPGFCAAAIAAACERLFEGPTTNVSKVYSVSQNAWLNSNFSIENTLTYDLPVISGHKISAMVGQSFQSTGWSTNIGGSNSVAYGSQLATLKGWNTAYLSNVKLAEATVASLTGKPNDEEYLV